MTGDTDFSNINEVKAEMGSIYDQPDPRAYFSTLEKLDYTIPGKAKPLFQRFISQLRQRSGQDEICVLDLGCSYGVNAALLKYDLSMDELYEHWTQENMKCATTEAVIEDDQRFFDKLDDWKT